MTDDRWISALRAMDRPVDPDPTFADELFDSLVRDLRGRRPAPSLLLVAAVLVLTFLLAGVAAIGSGLLRLPDFDRDSPLGEIPDVGLANVDEWGFGPIRPEYGEAWCEGHHPAFVFPREIEEDSARRGFECSLPDGGSASFDDRTVDGTAFLVRSELAIPVDDRGRQRAERWLASFEDGYPHAVAWLRTQLSDLRPTNGLPETDVSHAANGTAVLAGVAVDGEAGGAQLATLWLTTDAQLFPAPGCSLTLWQMQDRPDLPGAPQRMVSLSPVPPGDPLVVPLASRDDSGVPIAHVYMWGEGWGPRARFEITSESGKDWPSWTAGLGGEQFAAAETGSYRLEVASETTKCRASIPLEVVDDEDL